MPGTYCVEQKLNFIFSSWFIVHGDKDGSDVSAGGRSFVFSQRVRLQPS